ncbi:MULTISPECIES: MDR family MFS transporter [Cytobacillus]|uniref:MFS transporter n=1 Tax=Cytobacillus kochii TaxID=859143 RepID=A0A248TET1_9BACI|nr:MULTISPECIES: MDR family MFS transporter [Cytobacillus]ASV66684.1 MFS transporter [Cytobacillus kochii]MDQ0187658.1 DHA2 family lincomycin resistance protein-like MFS transporter [Cytobacillus kochii]MEA1854165.1 MDR family MFS transporter [Cytobacillus sp. OWB-43]MED1607216.1 MDR family MFS transporter [Cytobacillus kochii]
MTEKINDLQQVEIKPLPIAIVLMIAAFIGLFSETALNMAFTNIMVDYQIEPHAVQWLTTGFLLVLGVLVPVSGLLIQWFSTRQLFAASLIFSIIGTLIGALSISFPMLLICRVIQAIGTALLLPLMTNVILLIFPANKRGSVMGLMGLVIMCAPAIGPTISGLLIDQWGWHSIFWLSLPILIITLVVGMAFMQNVSTITKPRIDFVSLLLSTIGFGGVVYGFSSAGEGNGSWVSPLVLLPIVIGVISLLLFSIRQLRSPEPMLDLRVFAHPMFSLGTIMVFLCMMMILSSAILLPLYLKGGLLLTALAAGLVLLPGGLINGLMSPVTGRLFDRFGPRYLIIPGFVLTTIMTFLFTRVTTETSSALIIFLHTVMLIGVAMIMMPAQTNGLNQLSRRHYPDGSAIMNTLSQIAGAIGTAVAISLMAAGQSSYIPKEGMANTAIAAEALTTGVQTAFYLGLIASIIGLVLSFFVKRVYVEDETK